MPLLLLSLIVFAGFALYRTVQARRESAPIVVPVPDRPAPPRHQRVTDDELDHRAATLRDAISSGTVTLREAVDSLSRTCGIEESDARRRLTA